MSSPNDSPTPQSAVSARNRSWRRDSAVALIAAALCGAVLLVVYFWQSASSDLHESAARPPITIDSMPRSHTPDVQLASTTNATPESGAPRSLPELNARLQSDPDDVDALLERGSTYYRLRDFDKSEADFVAAANVAPDDPRVWEGFGFLHDLRHRSADARAAYDRAVDLGSKNVEILCNRAELLRQAKQYEDAVADFTKALAMLSEDDYSVRAYKVRCQCYHLRGCTWLALGRLDVASQDFERLLELRPESLTPRVELARVYFTRRDYDKFATQLWEAIQLNSGDVGNDYVLTTERSLSTEAISHGEEQLQQMLKDRPALAEHIVPGDQLWAWTVRKFAGEDTGILVDWNSSDPKPFGADSGESQLNVGHAQIRVQDARTDALTDQQASFERMWRWVVFELHNVAASKDFWGLQMQAYDGRLSRDKYIIAVCSVEELSKQRTRAFYLKLFLPWMRSKNVSSTCANDWYCFVFYLNDAARDAYFRTLPHWEYYSAGFDLLRIASAYKRHDRAEMTKHLAILEARRGSLVPIHLEKLEHWNMESTKLQGASGNPLDLFDSESIAVPQ